MNAARSAWFEDPAVCRAARRGQFGKVLRASRLAAGLSQQQVGDRLGYSRATVSRYETGDLRLSDVALLRRIAGSMGIPDRLFGLAHPGPQAATLEPVIQRREVVTGLAASAALASAAVASAALPGAGLLHDLNAALVGTAQVPWQPQALSRALACARALFTTCRWQELAAALPPLIQAAQAARASAACDRTAQADAFLSHVYVLANELAIKLHVNPTAWVLADRAVAAARASGDPRAVAAAQWRMAICLRRSRQPDSAAPLVAATARDLKTATDLATPGDAGFYTRLLCCGAYTVAMDGHASEAFELIEAARQARAEYPHGLFTADGIDLYAISVARAVGEFGKACGFSARVRIGALGDVERRTRYLEDTAIAWWGAGDPPRTFAALRAAEALSPQEVRLRPWAHRLTLNLLSCPKRTGLSGLREFAARIGLGAVAL